MSDHHEDQERIDIDVRARGVRCRLAFRDPDEIDRVLAGFRAIGIGIGPDDDLGRTGASSLRRTRAELQILLRTIEEKVDPQDLPESDVDRCILANAPRDLRSVITLIERVIAGGDGG